MPQKTGWVNPGSGAIFLRALILVEGAKIGVILSNPVIALCGSCGVYCIERGGER